MNSISYSIVVLAGSICIAAGIFARTPDTTFFVMAAGAVMSASGLYLLFDERRCAVASELVEPIVEVMKSKHEGRV